MLIVLIQVLVSLEHEGDRIIHVSGRLGDDELIAEVDTPWTGEKSLAEVKWNYSEGAGSLLLQTGGRTLAEGNVRWDLKHFTDKGKWHFILD